MSKDTLEERCLKYNISGICIREMLIDILV